MVLVFVECHDCRFGCSQNLDVHKILTAQEENKWVLLPGTVIPEESDFLFSGKQRKRLLHCLVLERALPSKVPLSGTVIQRSLIEKRKHDDSAPLAPFPFPFSFLTAQSTPGELGFFQDKNKIDNYNKLPL